MNQLETHAAAEGLFTYLKDNYPSPLDGIAVLGLTLLMIFDTSTDGTITIARFAEDFKQSLLASYKTKSDQGSGLVQ